MEAVTPIPKIRAGNEFTFIWAISRDGIAENLTDAAITDLKLTVCVGGLCAERVEVPFTIVDTNKIKSSHLYERTGTYNLELTYKKAGVENEIDIEAFKIVSRSAEASDSSEFAVSSDMAIGFKGDKGDKGDPFLYTDFTQEQLDDLMKPANDKVADIELLESQISSAEAIREDNETDRQSAEGLRISAETSRQTAEGSRQTNTATAITNANTAATNANTKAGLANDAATLANTKAGLANDAATAANNAAEAVAPSVINNEEVQAEVYNMLNARIAALEAIIAAGVYNYIQADTLIGVNSLQYKGAELILTGTAAPAIAPDFVGQVFVNTTGGVTYMAKGIASAADWKQTSN